MPIARGVVAVEVRQMLYFGGIYRTNSTGEVGFDGKFSHVGNTEPDSTYPLKQPTASNMIAPQNRQIVLAGDPSFNLKNDLCRIWFYLCRACVRIHCKLADAQRIRANE